MQEVVVEPAEVGTKVPSIVDPKLRHKRRTLIELFLIFVDHGGVFVALAIAFSILASFYIGAAVYLNLLRLLSRHFDFLSADPAVRLALLTADQLLSMSCNFLDVMFYPAAALYIGAFWWHFDMLRQTHREACKSMEAAARVWCIRAVQYLCPDAQPLIVEMFDNGSDQSSITHTELAIKVCKLGVYFMWVYVPTALLIIGTFVSLGAVAI